jgi:hypothetical protein
MGLYRKLVAECAIAPVRPRWVMTKTKLSGDPSASAMQERAAVADICPNTAAHEHQRNGQSKENVHFTNSHAGLTNPDGVNRSVASSDGATATCAGLMQWSWPN